MADGVSEPAMAAVWPGDIAVAQVRIARPTDRLEAVEAFYRDGLGLPVLARFAAHQGYDGVMLGLPGRDHHLEFTRHREGSPCPAPSRDNLLVLYIPDPAHFDAARRRLESQGHLPVEPENPWWRARALTYEDPDGWRVVLCRDSGIAG